MPLPWFRRKKSEEQAPSAAASVPPAASAPTVEQPAAPAAGDDGQPTSTAAKRRRGTRGGRNRKKKPAEGSTAGTEKSTSERSGAAKPAAAKPAAADKRGGERKTRDRTATSQAARRRTPPKRAPLPKAKRELLISVDAGEKRVAVLEDDLVAEVYLERPERRSIAGNIYLGTVDNVLPGMEAAFVEIGLEKNGFLYVDEIVGPELEGRKGARKIQDLIQRGQSVLVQAVKDPMKTKGARLTTEISLPGRFVVFVPHGDGLGVSRRIEDDERNRLKAILKEIAPKQGGVIVRTAAEGASAEDIERDLDFLQRLWRSIEAQAKDAKAPSLVYQEAELPLRVVRDLFTGDFERLLVDHDRTHKRIVGYLKKTSPHMAERVTRFKERDSLMDTFGVEQEIKSTLNRRVDLPSGGYLIFDYAEAFTVIDVNTGRFVGSRSKNSGARLEDTITKNNLEAVKEVVRQLRLRDIGGIIVIDFIDMASPKNRAAVEAALGEELERDRTKTYVVEISPLGLVEMTRQNVTDGPREVMTKKCPTCGGDGIVVSEHTAAVDVERRLRTLVTPGSRDKAFKVEVAAKVAALVVGPGGSRLRELEETTKRRFFLVGKEGEHLDHFKVLGQGTLEKVAPTLPVDVGQELDLKLGEVGLHDPHAGVGKVESIDVVIGDAAKLVGKKVKVRITAVTEGLAWGELLSPVEQVREPLTAESEAEKPTRAKRSTTKKPGDEGIEIEETDDADADGDEAEPVAAETGAELGEAGEPAPVVLDENGEPIVPKKRTRRGTRGGRNRKKKPVEAGAGTEDGVAPAELSDTADDNTATSETVVEPALESKPPARPAGPVIHVPERALAGEEETEDGDTSAAPPKKRTRRGSRGGKNRKKKPVGEDAASVTDEAGVLEADAPETEAEAIESAALVEVADEEAAPAPKPERAPARPRSRPAPQADAEPAGESGPAEAANGAGPAEDENWGYTPMSEWGIDE
ncbi:MAG: Rne/Rng family ribonuclease [Actinobacteria bacterium]|nr:Rne/Rng family ribonuclease [Actinomycetota bacterium]